jgi:hypothetical protein
MTKTNSEGQRLPWSAPDVRRIRAGLAESGKSQDIPDGGTTPGQEKS